LSTPQSGLLDKTRYGFNSRFGDEKGHQSGRADRRRARRLFHHGAVGQAW
jgi:hypothetical protein